MVRRPHPLIITKPGEALEPIIPVRVTDMRGVDLNVWRFDWDLTFAAVIVHPDGTLLASYGGRDERGADHWLTERSYAAFLKAGLDAYAAAPEVDKKQNEPTSPLTVDSIPAFAERDRGVCIHCHSALPALRHQAQREDRWKEESLWVYPPPSKIGVDLDRDEQALVTPVQEGSAAARAGVKIGDRLANFASASDLMNWLDGLPASGAAHELEVLRAGETVTLPLRLPENWKTYTPREFAWRPSKWGLSPAPGFGGPVLGKGALERAGLDSDTFAFQVNYLVTWGENQRWGQAAARSGIRDGMVV
ncbi:MAG: thioredoxin family protein, partial [Planctomycetota bacterium]